MRAAKRQYHPPQRFTRAGVELPRDADGRTRRARRFKKWVDDFTAELGGSLSAADQALVRQGAALTLRAEQAQCDVVNGIAVDADDLVRISSGARRILGLLRRKGEKAKPPVGPTLDELFAAEEARAE